jgi:hypothetical protein
MKIVVAALVAFTTTSLMAGQTYVRPHVTKNGTYVEGHQRTTPNGTKTDNYSTKGNINPYTGKSGTVDPYAPKSTN